MQNTKVVSSSGESITTSATFKSLAGNIVVSDITFVVSFSFEKFHEFSPQFFSFILEFVPFLSFFFFLFKEHLHLSIKEWILCIYIKHLVNKN